MRESTKLCVNLAVNLKIKNPAHNAQPVQNNLEDHLLLNYFIKRPLSLIQFYYIKNNLICQDICKGNVKKRGFQKL